RPPKVVTGAAKAPGQKPAAGKRAPQKPKREGKSIRWMVTALLVMVAFMAWAIAAAGYASDVGQLHRPDSPLRQGRAAARSAGIIWLVEGFGRFLGNAVVQVPSAHRVAWHTVTRHPVLLIVTALFAGGVGLFGWWMSGLERQFAKQDERFRRVADG